MTSIETFGKCKCGEYSALSAVVCDSCGARLPWAAAPRKSKASGGYPAAPPNSAVASVTTRTQMAQAGYWNSALGGAGAAAASNYGTDPDIDFTPLSPMTRVDRYCPSCGMGLSRSQERCPRCRHMPNFTRADLRLSLMVGALITTGFLLGVVWCSFLVAYLQTGKWPLISYPTTTQTAPAKKTPDKPKPAPEYRGTPAQ